MARRQDGTRGVSRNTALIAIVIIGLLVVAACAIAINRGGDPVDTVPEAPGDPAGTPAPGQPSSLLPPREAAPVVFALDATWRLEAPAVVLRGSGTVGAGDRVASVAREYRSAREPSGAGFARAVS